ncbi:MAG: phage tail protein [Xanthomonadales bacterium]|jgi:hypothetical protein|nr:phage tail protein [Xanthomonadales bacterium]
MGSGKKVTVGYRYYLGLHMGLCHGPVDAVKSLVVGDRAAWNGNQTTSGAVSVSAPELFGGDKKEGGVVGTLDILMGESTQVENSYLASTIGATIPAFRGILSAVWRGGQVTANNPYIKPWAFRVKRILQGWVGGSAWYPEKAEIYSQEILGSTTHEGYFYVEAGSAYHNVAHTAYPLPEGYGYVATGYIGTIDAIGTNCINARNDASGSTYTYLSSVLVVEDGTLYVSARSVQLGADVGISAVIVTPSCPSGYTGSFIEGEGGSVSVACTLYSSCEQFDMNPAHIIYQCLTDTAWGMGYPTSSIDNDSFTSSADTLFSEGFGLSMVWNQQDTIEAFLKIILDHIGGILYVKPDTSLFALKLIRDDYDRETLPQYGPNNLLSADDYQRQAWGETINEITVVYIAACTNNQTAVTVQDVANIQIQGGVVAQTRNYPGIRRADIAQRVALRDLNTVSTPLAKIKLTATRAAWEVFPGDVFRLTWPDYGIDDAVYRCLAVNRGTLQNGEIIIDASEDVFGLPENTYLVNQPGEWVNPSNPPAAATYRKLIEAPYWDLIRSLTEADMAYVDSLSGYLETLAVRPSGDAVNYSIYDRIGAENYAADGNGDFCPSALVVEALTKTTTAITLSGGIDIDLVEPGGYAVIENEYVLVSAIDAGANTATISRGVLDTVPADHVAGSRIFFADGYAGFSTTEFADSETLDVKLLPLTGQGELDISLAPVDTLTFDQRQYRPYPPGNVKYSGSISPSASSYPTTITGDLTITWAHRDRLTQTAYIVEQDETSIGPEAGTTYTVEIREGVTLIESASGISGTSYAASVSGSATEIEVTLFAMRDGLRSWQSHVHTMTITADNNLLAEDGATFADEAGDTMILE